MRFNFNLTVISLFSLLISYIRAEEAEALDSDLENLIKSKISEKLSKLKDQSVSIVEKTVSTSQEAVNNAPKDSSGTPNPSEETTQETNTESQ